MEQLRIFMLRKINNAMLTCKNEVLDPILPLLAVVKHLVHATNEVKANNMARDMAALHSKVDLILKHQNFCPGGCAELLSKPVPLQANNSAANHDALGSPSPNQHNNRRLLQPIAHAPRGTLIESMHASSPGPSEIEGIRTPPDEEHQRVHMVHHANLANQAAGDCVNGSMLKATGDTADARASVKVRMSDSMLQSCSAVNPSVCRVKKRRVAP